jgi:putative flavoprotein involved in K+ transport
MRDSVDVAVVGAGQAGLAAAWYLTQEGIEHVVLEAGRLGETWRSRRWDSFCLVTPNWSVQLPGGSYRGPDPDGYLPLAEIVDYLESYAGSFQAPVLEQSPVSRLCVDPSGGFQLALPEGTLRARTVVVASGAYQRAHRPAGAEAVPPSLRQLLAEEYANPSALPPGAVVVVGSGQTGCQLAEELYEAGRTVYLACGRCPWAPRRIGDYDVVRWVVDTGFWDARLESLPSPQGRLVGNIQSSGHGGGHDLNYRTLRDQGVRLLGRFMGAEEGALHFADDLAASVAFGDARYHDFAQLVREVCRRRGLTAPELPAPEPFAPSPAVALDVERERISTLIWTSGYRPEYGWVEAPVFDAMGFPITIDGATATPGLYFVGVHFLRKRKSSLLYGVGEDAELVVRDIAARRLEVVRR